MTHHKCIIAKEKLISISFVFVLHFVAFLAVWQHPLPPDSPQVAILFVRFISPPSPAKKDEHKSEPPEKPSQSAAREVRPVVNSSLVAPDHSAAQPQMSDPIASSQAFEAPDMPIPVGPVTLSSELAVICANRSAPTYPPISRQLREEGTVVLRVELSENGLVDMAEIRQSSGFFRLDKAALLAVKNWRCSAPLNAGQPVRAVALQPFNFELKR